jgi:hypothetical protein
MTKIYLPLLFILTFFLQSLNSQNLPVTPNIEMAKIKSGDIIKFFSENIQYPPNALMDNIEGMVLIGFRITKVGLIDSIQVIKNPNQNLSLEVLRVLDKTNGLWIPTKSNGIPIDKNYIAIFGFFTSTKYHNLRNKGLNYFKKRDFNKALISINKSLAIDEYDTKLYETRLTIYKNLNDVESIKRDSAKIDYLKRNLITSIYVTAMSVRR